MELDAKIPEGPVAEKWDKHRFDMKLINPANKRKYEVIVVGSGLAGASAAMLVPTLIGFSLGELLRNRLSVDGFRNALLIVFLSRRPGWPNARCDRDKISPDLFFDHHGFKPGTHHTGTPRCVGHPGAL